MVLWFMVKTDNTAYQALVLVWLGCGKNWTWTLNSYLNIYKKKHETFPLRAHDVKYAALCLAFWLKITEPL